MAELADAYIQLIPSIKGLSDAIKKELGDGYKQIPTQTWGEKIKGSVGGAFKTAGKIGVGAMAGVATAVAGLALKGGISRALNIEDAKAKLKGLGHSVQGVDAIMSSAEASVKGTAYSLGDAATVAATLSATGLKAGENLDGALKSVADVAQITGRSLTDVGAIFASVAARGKLQGDDMLQLMKSGFPVLEALGERLGLTSEEISEMVSRGEIDFATFQAAMEDYVGGSALAAGETFRGAWANIKNALSRGGEAIATPMLEGLRVAFLDTIPVIDSFVKKITPTLETIGTSIGNAAGKVAEFAGQWVTSGGIVTPEWLTPLIEGFQALWQGIQDAAATIIPVVVGIGEALVAGFNAVAPVLSPVIGGILELTGTILSNETAVQSLLVALGAAASIYAGFKLGGLIADMATLYTKLVVQAAGWGALVAAKAADIAQTVALNAMYAGEFLRNLAMTTAELGKNAAAWAIGTAKKTADIAVTVAQKAATIGAAAATKAAAVAQWALNAAMSANPIGLVVVALAALAAALVYAWNHSETFRTTVTNAWEAVKNAVGTAIAFIRTIITNVLNAVSAFWAATWGAISAKATAVWNAIQIAVTVGTAVIRSLISNVMATVRGLWSAGWNAVTSYVTSAWSSIRSGVSSGISSMISLVASIPGRITGALGNLGGLLWNAGASVIRGFINGIKSMIGSVRSTLSGLTSMLPSWKGPAQVDAKILQKSGELVMGGFQAGLESQFGAVQSTLEGFTKSLIPEIPIAPAQHYRHLNEKPAHDTDGITVHQYIQSAEVPKASKLLSEGAAQARLIGAIA